MVEKVSKQIAVIMLGTMFLLLFFSAWGDSATMDELAHIPAGYSYLSEQDFRINPEHPPLIKDLSAIPLMFLNLNFPTDDPSWTVAINGQWDLGRIFIYESGNDADQIIFWSRLPIMLLAILFGWMFFKWIRGLYGDKVALLALFFFVSSPTFLAHSRYVTTDLAAAFGFFIGLASFINFIRRDTKKDLIIAGIAFGVAQLLKFSLVILVPIYIILGILWVFLKNYENFAFGKFIKESLVIGGKIILIGLIGLAIVWPTYVYHTWNYPMERQVSDMSHILNTFRVKIISNSVIWMASMPSLRALGEYLFGILMVMQRAAGGNNVFLLGEVANKGWPIYFPLLYLLKEHLALNILALISMLFGLNNIRKSKDKNLKTFFAWLKDNFALTTSFIFIAIYWAQAITSPLNIGVRHVLPTFPFIYLLISRQTIRWVKGYSLETPSDFLGALKSFYRNYLRPLKRGLCLILLLSWMAIATLITYPHYLSYYNELGGGTWNGYKIAVDSNYDWGQDLKRLVAFFETVPESEKQNGIAIDYFGGGNPHYYFGDQAKIWHSNTGSPIDHGITWFAVSATFFQESRAVPVKGFIRLPEDTFSWLGDKKPVARAGTSIFIYKFE